MTGTKFPYKASFNTALSGQLFRAVPAGSGRRPGIMGREATRRQNTRQNSNRPRHRRALPSGRRCFLPRTTVTSTVRPRVGFPCRGGAARVRDGSGWAWRAPNRRERRPDYLKCPPVSTILRSHLQGALPQRRNADFPRWLDSWTQAAIRSAIRTYVAMQIKLRTQTAANLNVVGVLGGWSGWGGTLERG